MQTHPSQSSLWTTDLSCPAPFTAGRRCVLIACLGLVLLASVGACGPVATYVPSPGLPAARTSTPDYAASPLATPTPDCATSPLATITSPPPPASVPAATPSLEASPAAPVRIPAYSYRVVQAYPHDRSAYTEGLVLASGVLYEGTGLVGRSSLRRVDLETGAVLQSSELPVPHFGEGIAVLGDEIFQLTWKSRTGFVYDRETLQRERTFAYATEGWGLTTDGRRLVMSDGTETLRFLDPATLQVVSSVPVRDEQGPVTHLNELEFIEGEIWANVWLTDRVVRIDPATGRLTGVIDLTGLLDTAGRPAKVDALNGIAYDAEHDRLFVTGKLWPWLFEIEIVPQHEE